MADFKSPVDHYSSNKQHYGKCWSGSDTTRTFRRIGNKKTILISIKSGKTFILKTLPFEFEIFLNFFFIFLIFTERKRILG